MCGNCTCVFYQQRSKGGHTGIEDTLSGPHSFKETLVKKQVLTKLRLVSKVKDFRSRILGQC